MRKRKTKNEVQMRFSKLGENEKQKEKLKSVFQCHAKTKNEKWKWNLNSIFLCHRKTVGTKVHALKRLALSKTGQRNLNDQFAEPSHC